MLWSNSHSVVPSRPNFPSGHTWQVYDLLETLAPFELCSDDPSWETYPAGHPPTVICALGAYTSLLLWRKLTPWRLIWDNICMFEIV